MGDDIVPGHPEASVLMDFIEGKRGPRQRMPQDSAPLTTAQIELVRRWIQEGATNDGIELPCFELRIPNVALSSSAPLEVSARIAAPAFLTLALSPTLYRRSQRQCAQRTRQYRGPWRMDSLAANTRTRLAVFGGRYVAHPIFHRSTRSNDAYRR